MQPSKPLSILIIQPSKSLSIKWGRRNARSVPPPHRRWRRVLNSQSKSWPNIYQAQDAQLQKPRPRSPDYPLSISPPGSAHSAVPAQNR